MSDSEETPRFQRLGPVNWLPEERKLVERYEQRIRELEKKLATQEARADYAIWKLRATQTQRPFRVAQALTGATNPKKLVRLPQNLNKALRTRKSPKAPVTVVDAAELAENATPEVKIPTLQW